MPQKNAIDFSDLGAKQVIDFSDLGARPVDARKTSAKPRTPDPGVSGPTRDMDPRTHQNALWAEAGATLLEPFSARDGKGNWKVPDILAGPARLAWGLTAGAPQAMSDLAQGKPPRNVQAAEDLATGVIQGVVEPVTTLATSDDPRERVGAGVRLMS